MVKKRRMKRTHAAYGALLGAVAAERLWELWLSKRHAAWAKQRGGLEFGRWQLNVMAALQTGLLAGSFAEVTLLRRRARLGLALPMLGVVGAAQALRYWAVHTLGRRWNTRVIVVPGLPAVTGGPYRYVRHPNYVAVIAEGLALPLVHSAYFTAAAFTVANALVLKARVRCEEKALATHNQYEQLLGNKQRFVPSLMRQP